MAGQAGKTVVVTRVVRPGKENEFTAWAEEVDATAARFDGHLGAVRLQDDQGLNHLVYLFDDEDHLRAWESSPQRRDLVERGNDLSDDQRTTADGRNSWFTVPSNSPNWKSFLVTWLVVYPSLLVIATTVGWLAPGLSQPVQLAISSGTLTALLTWVILPRVTNRMRPWLFRGARPQSRRPTAD
jgi:antibiotic biosynthesis monooxygenase (ABM) superfamily enzyme